jgi:hypothetical protein
LRRLGGLSLVERAVQSLLATGLERVLVVVGHDAGPVATVVGRLGRGRVRAVYADRWSDGNGASLAAVQGEVQGEALFVLVTADHVFGEGALDRLLAAGGPAVLIDLAPDRPVYHRKEQRIRAHVILCWLALLLTRTIEATCGDTWPTLRRELQRITVGTFAGPAGTFRQRTEITSTQRAILAKLQLADPPRIYQLSPATADS